VKSRDELGRNVAAAALAGLVQPTIFNPLECLRVRWQVSQAAALGGGGLSSFAAAVVRSEGLWEGLWRPGLPLNMGAVTLSQGLRLGLYPTCRDFALSLPSRGSSSADGAPKKSPIAMLAAGLVAGSIAYFVSAPFWLAKTRAQAYAQLRSEASAAAGVASTAGAGAGSGNPLALWRGCSPLVVRGALLTGGQMLGYDGTKTFAASELGLPDGPGLHVLAAVLAGLCATTFSAPADVLVTRFQCRDQNGNAYRSVLDCATSLLRQSGPAVFFRGWSANFLRLAPTFAVGSVLYEQSRLAMGLSYMT